MNKINAIQRLEKHKNELKKRVKEIEEIISSMQNGIENDRPPEKMRNDVFGENEFNQIVTNHECDLSVYRISADIINNKQTMYDFWRQLNEESKTAFTIPELNLIRWLISDLFDKYGKKNKRELISSIDEIVRNRRMRKSYERIIV
jgi:hypothetical protein